MECKENGNTAKRHYSRNSFYHENPLSNKLTPLGELSPSLAECTGTFTGPWLPGPRIMTPGFRRARGGAPQ